MAVKILSESFPLGAGLQGLCSFCLGLQESTRSRMLNNQRLPSILIPLDLAGDLADGPPNPNGRYGSFVARRRKPEAKNTPRNLHGTCHLLRLGLKHQGEAAREFPRQLGSYSFGINKQIVWKLLTSLDKGWFNRSHMIFPWSSIWFNA